MLFRSQQQHEQCITRHTDGSHIRVLCFTPGQRTQRREGNPPVYMPLYQYTLIGVLGTRSVWPYEIPFLGCEYYHRRVSGSENRYYEDSKFLVRERGGSSPGAS